MGQFRTAGSIPADTTDNVYSEADLRRLHESVLTHGKALPHISSRISGWCEKEWMLSHSARTKTFCGKLKRIRGTALNLLWTGYLRWRKNKRAEDNNVCPYGGTALPQPTQTWYGGGRLRPKEKAGLRNFDFLRKLCYTICRK